MNSPQYCLVVNRAKRLNAMIERLNVDPLKLVRKREGAAYFEARDACLRCHHGHICQTWIELASMDVRPDFCPNLPLFERVRRV